MNIEKKYNKAYNKEKLKPLKSNYKGNHKFAGVNCQCEDKWHKLTDSVYQLQ